MAEETVVVRVIVESDKAEKQLEEVAEATEKVAESTGDMDKALEKLPAPLGKVKAGVGAVSKAFKMLLANPIVAVITALVGALGLLFKAFSSSQAGADKLGNATARLSAMWDTFQEMILKVAERLGSVFKDPIESIKNLGKALMDNVVNRFKALPDLAIAVFKTVKNAITLNFEEAKESAKDVGQAFIQMHTGLDVEQQKKFADAVKNVGQQLRDAGDDAVRYEEAVRRLYERETEVIDQNAKLRRSLAEQVLISRDLTLSAEDRRKAIVKAGEFEQAIADNNLELQRERLRLAEQDKKNTPDLLKRRELDRKIAEESAKLSEMETNSMNAKRELLNRLNTLQAELDREEQARLNEQIAKQKELNDAILKREELLAKFNKKLMEDELEVDKLFAEMEEEDRKQRLENIKAFNEAVTESVVEQSEKRFEAEEKADQKRRELRDAWMGFEQNMWNASTQLIIEAFGEQSKVGKAVAVADATRSAIQGAINAYASAQKLPFPASQILGAILATTTLATGMMNVRKIASVNDGVTGGGGASVPSVSLATAGANLGDIAQADLGLPQEVSLVRDTTGRGNVKAYVVQSEITAEMDIERQKQSQSTL